MWVGSYVGTWSKAKYHIGHFATCQVPAILRPAERSCTNLDTDPNNCGDCGKKVSLEDPTCEQIPLKRSLDRNKI